MLREKIGNYWKIFTSHFSNPANRKILSLIALTIIVVALPIIVLVAQQQQKTRQHASEPNQTAPLTQDQTANQIRQLTRQLLQSNKIPTATTQSLKAKQIIESQTAVIVEIAKKRKTLLLQLAEKNPPLFLAIVAKKITQATMPAAAQDYIEKETAVEGTIEVYHTDDFKNPENSKFNYFLNIDGKKLTFYPTQELSITSGAKVRVKGIQLSNTITTTTDKASFQVLEEAPKPESVGDQRMLVLLIRFLNSGSEPYPKEKAYDLIFNNQFQKFYKEQSYNQVSFSGDVFGWISLDRNHILASCPTNLQDDLSRIATDNHIDPGNYDRILFVISSVEGGCSGVGKQQVVINGKSYDMSMAFVGSDGQDIHWRDQAVTWSHFDFALTHELGHSLGILHANGWNCKEQIIEGACEYIEYGNAFDVMGMGENSLHFNAFYKEELGWIKPSEDLLISTSGAYTINPLELNSNTKLAKIQMQDSDIIPFYLEYRKAIGFDTNLNSDSLSSNQSGLFINLVRDSFVFGSSPRLLDMSPTSLAWFGDIRQTTLNDNNIFTDQPNGITIGPILKTDESSITFNVDLKQPVCAANSPIIENEGNSVNVPAGTDSAGYAYYNFTNKDSFACGESNFNLIPTLPSSWSYQIYPPDNITLAPNETGFVSMNFTVPENTPSGDYPISVDLVNLKTDLKIHREFTVAVKPAPKISRIDPPSGPVGTKFTVFGSGFDQTPNKNAFTIYSYTPQSYSYYTETVSEISQVQNEQAFKFTMPDTITYCTISGGKGAPVILGGGGGAGGGGGDSTCSKIPTPLGIYSVYIYVEDLGLSNTISFELAVPSPLPTPTPTPVGKLPPCGKYGDLNLDTRISTADAQLIANYLVGNITLTDQQKILADVNADGKVAINDSLFIAQYSNGVRPTFPACSGPAITIFTPKGGTYEVGKTIDVTWFYAGAAECLVNINLVNGNNTYEPGGTGTPIAASIGKYPLTISPTTPGGTNYKIEVNGGKTCGSVQTVNFSIVAPTPTPLAGKIPPCGNYGDVDTIDGRVTLGDANLIQRFLVGTSPLNDEQKKRADVNKDGKITGADSLFIAQYASGSRKTFPACQ